MTDVAAGILSLILSLLLPAVVNPASGPSARAGFVADTAFVAVGDSRAVMAIGGGALTLSEGATEGYYTSAVKEAEFPFNAVAARWRASLPEGAALAAEVRTRPEDGDWSAWQPLSPLDCHAGIPSSASDVVVATGKHLQYRVRLSTAIAGAMPRLDEFTLVYIDTSDGPSLAQAQAAATPLPPVAGGVRPSVIPRSGWGANESYRYSGGEEVWPIERVHPEKVIVHHTVTTNDDPDPAATMRAIYYYHAVVLGWGDIGYNYVIDRQGNIYEGRAGGEKVIGGHAQRHNVGSIGIAALGDYRSVGPTSQMEAALTALAAWCSVRYGISPTGSGFFIDRELPNIMGHRDAGNTTCPGDGLYARLGAVRSGAWQRLPQYGEAWVSHNTATTMPPGAASSAQIVVRNAGSRTWTASGTYRFQLGYHWYDAAGRQVAQRAEDDRRSRLPHDIAPGQAVTLTASVVAPSIRASYTLKWDMVHEGYTWFAGQGNEPLTVAVAVADAPYRAAWGSHTTPMTFTLGQTATATIEVENRGSNTWVKDGARAYRLGYHWYDAAGRQVAQSAEDDRRTSLPRDVAPGERATLTATVTAPRAAGRYTLKWDMVHEGYTWFADQGSPTLDVAATVAEAALRVSPDRLSLEASVDFSSVSANLGVEGNAGFRAEADQPWLGVEPTSGTAPTTLRVTATVSGLSPGRYDGTVTLTPTDDGVSSVTVPVGLVVSERVAYRLYIPFAGRS